LLCIVGFSVRCQFPVCSNHLPAVVDVLREFSSSSAPLEVVMCKVNGKRISFSTARNSSTENGRILSVSVARLSHRHLPILLSRAVILGTFLKLPLVHNALRSLSLGPVTISLPLLPLLTPVMWLHDGHQFCYATVADIRELSIVMLICSSFLCSSIRITVIHISSKK
jgi:hypothetical protein